MVFSYPMQSSLAVLCADFRKVLELDKKNTQAAEELGIVEVC